jgi:toxin ParE1/3/4
MTREIVITQNARADVKKHFAYLSQNNPDAALKFFDATRETYAQLARMPGMGSIYEVENPRLSEIRKWSVKGFKNYLIFYVVHEEFIEIMRVIYARQDIQKILGLE